MSQRLLYFAYGSNMYSPRLRARVDAARPIGVGHVTGRRLTVDKVGMDGSGKCDIELTNIDADRVHGVLFELRREDLLVLDRFEGRGRGYERETVIVAGHLEAIEALTYVATRKDPALRPYDWYKKLVVHGALEHGLPDAYLAALRALPSIPDPDAARHARESSLLRP